MTGLRFLARLPIVALLITATMLSAFVVFMLLFRLTQWMWLNWLAEPWA